MADDDQLPKYRGSIDCFMSTCVRNEIREAYAKVALDYWTRVPQLKRLVILDFGSDQGFLNYVQGLQMKPRDFTQNPPAFIPDGRTIEIIKFGDIGTESYFRRRIEAEKLATTEKYLMIDDDCVMCDRHSGWLNGNDLCLMIDLLKEHPNYGAIHPRVTNFPSSVIDGADLMENYNTGGIRLHRKGCGVDKLPIPNPLPEQGQMNDDNIACEFLRDRGWKVGLASDIWFYHLGVQSTIWTHSRL